MRIRTKQYLRPSPVSYNPSLLSSLKLFAGKGLMSDKPQNKRITLINIIPTMPAPTCVLSTMLIDDGDVSVVRHDGLLQ